ncbi:MAG: hypothetical protein AAF483_29875 [Planctomycetota bacterium]
MNQTAYSPDDAGGQSNGGGESSGSPLAIQLLSIPLGILVCLAGMILIGKVADNNPDGEHIFYPPPHGQLGDPPEYIAAVKAAQTGNTAIGFAIITPIVMLVLGGLIVSVSRGSVALVLGCGVFLGALLGAAAGAGSYFIQSSLAQSDMDGLIKTFLVWLPLGFVFGSLPSLMAVFSGVSKSIPTAILTGVIGGGLAVSVYVLLSAFLFLGHPNFVYPIDLDIRITAYTCLGIAAGSGVSILLAMTEPTPRTSGAETKDVFN